MLWLQLFSPRSAGEYWSSSHLWPVEGALFMGNQGESKRPHAPIGSHLLWAGMENYLCHFGYSSLRKLLIF